MAFVVSGIQAAVAAVMCIAVALTMFTPAAAQKMGRGEKSNPQNEATAIEKKKKAREIDEAYKASLKAIPDKPKPDPWDGMRSK